MNILQLLLGQQAGGPPPPLRMPEWMTSGRGSPIIPQDEDESGFMPLVPQTKALPPTTPANLPEPHSTPAPLDKGPSIAMPTEAAPRKSRKGVLGFLEDVFMPEADSRWAAALRGGIYDAKANQQLYRANQAAAAEKAASDRAARVLAERKAMQPTLQVAGNNVLRTDPTTGEASWMPAPAQPTETERLIDKWRDPATDPETKAIIERVLRGYQYTPEVINARESARERTVTNVARVRGEEARRTKRTPGATNSRSGGVKLPPGFELER